MSYDLCLKIYTKSGNRLLYKVFDNGHITYNVSEMLVALGIKSKASHLNMSFNEWIPKLENALNELENNINEYKQYDSPNGWGTAENTFEILKKLWVEIQEDLEDCQLRKSVEDGDVFISWLI